MKYLLPLILLTGCSKLPPKPNVFVCSPVVYEGVADACICVNSIDHKTSKVIPIEDCDVGFTADDWVKIDRYIKDLKHIVEKQCSK